MTHLPLCACILFVASLGAVNSLPKNNSLRTTDCRVTSYTEASKVSQCDTVVVGSFTVPAKTTLTFNLKKGAKLTFTGEISWSYSGYWANGILMGIVGDDVTVIGASGHLLHGHGEQYWNGKSESGKPIFMYLHGSNSNYKGLKFKNCPERCIGIDDSHQVVIDNFYIDNSAGNNLAYNTDGFDVAQSTYVTIKNSMITGQDDCVAINSGSFITVNNLHCIGTHGFDVAVGQGSQYKDNIVHDVTFSNSLFTGGMVGLHILTCSDGGKGQVYNIVFENIQINGPSGYGIMIQQDFSNSKQGSTGTPVGNVPISNVNVTNVKGYMDGKFSTAVVIRCAACSSFHFQGISLTGAKASNECNYKPVDFTC